MAAAFDWSPGGCCCGSGPWFDVYRQSDLASQGHGLNRWTTLRLNGGVWNLQSDSTPGGIGWYVPDNGVLADKLTTATGFPAFGNNVWAFHRSNQSGTTFFLKRYDAATKTLHFSVPWPYSVPQDKDFSTGAVGISFGSPRVDGCGSAASSQTQFAAIVSPDAGGGPKFVQVSDTGIATVAAYTGQQTTSTTNLGGDLVKTVTESVDAITPRNYPRAAGSIQGVYKSASNGVEVSGFSQLYVGDLTINADGILTIANKSIVLKYTDNGGVKPYTKYQWLRFDSSPTHWVGLVCKSEFSFQTFGMVDSLLLVINGAIVSTLSVPSGTFGTAAAGYFGMPTVCHPHETLGDGWIAVPTATNTDVNRPWQIIVYKDGVESWRTQTLAVMSENFYPPMVEQSSDRWLYITDRGGINNADFTQKDHWRHDGSVSWRTGQLNAAGTDTIPDAHTQNQFIGRQWLAVLRSTAVVQNSAAVADSLPADFPPT